MFIALGRHGLEEDTADIAYVEIGAMAGPQAYVPASLLRRRHIRISGSGAGSVSIAKIMTELPVYIRMIAEGRVNVPTQVFPLSSIAAAWATATQSGTRVVVVPG
jgi:hypothetical protein